MKHTLLKSVALLAASTAVLAAVQTQIHQHLHLALLESKELTIYIDQGYETYINDVKAAFEKKTM